MNATLSIVDIAMSPATVERFGWLLVHSLWQFGLIAVLAFGAGLLMRRGSAHARYWMLVSAMSLMVVSPLITWHLLPGDRELLDAGGQVQVGGRELVSERREPSGSDGGFVPLETNDEEQGGSRRTATTVSETPVPDVSPIKPLTIAVGKPWWSVFADTFGPWLPTIVACWCGGVLLFSIRPVWSWFNVRRLRGVGTSPVPAHVAQTLADIGRRLRIRRRVEVLASTLVAGPVVAGCFRSVILLPVSFISTIPVPQLEAILAHELAHVRRHDYLINLLQTLVETLFFYHPAVWYVSHCIRVERENCCDDLAVAALNNRVEYGRALLAVAEHRGFASALALGARGGSLLARVRRVLGHGDVSSTSPAAGTLALFGGAIALTLSIWVGLLAAPPEPEELQVLPQPESTQWPMWGGSPSRNHASRAKNLPVKWDVKKGENIKWTAKLGSSSYASPVVAGGKVLIGTNNAGGRITRYPQDKDLSCLLCFDERTGDFLWQFSSEKLPTGRMHDWPVIGLCSTPCVVGDRVWLVTNRCEVVCLDLNGFLDDENDGPVTGEASTEKDEADIIWRFDLMGKLGVVPMYQSCSSATIVDNLVLVNTSNGLDESHRNIPAPAAPSFVALDRDTGRVVWQDASPGKNLLGAQCPSASPSVAKIDDTVQAIFGGGDGWVYAFDVKEMQQGRTKLLWKFDINAKTAKFIIGNRGDRNVVMAAPVVWENKVYVVAGANPEHGEGDGVLWCIDPRKRGDLSEELVFNEASPDKPIPHKRLQACEPDKGDFTKPNPGSGVIWKFTAADLNGDGKTEFAEKVHRSCAAPVIDRGLLFLADFSGILHCFDAVTGKAWWHYDLLAMVWATPVIADGKVYVADEDGDVAIFRLSKREELIGEVQVHDTICGTPAAVTGTLFLNTRSQLIAVGEQPANAARSGAFRLRDHGIVEDVRWMDDDRELMTVSIQGGVDVRRWDVKDRRLLSEIKLASDQHGRPVRQGTLKLSRDGRRVIAATDEYAGVWDGATGELLKRLAIPKKEWEYNSASCLECSPDGSVVVAGLSTNYTRTTLVYPSYGIAWDAVSGEVLCRFSQPNGYDVCDIAVFADGQRFATCSTGHRVCIWETESGKLLRDVSEAATRWTSPDVKVIKNNVVRGIALTRDDKQLAVAGTFGIRLVDVETGKLRRTIAAPYRIGQADVVFSADGKMIARYGTRPSREAGYSVEVWSTESGEKLFDFVTSADVADFSDNSLQLAIGESDFHEAVSIRPLSGAARQGPLAQPEPYSRVDRVEENTHARGKTAARYADRWKPAWGKEQHGLQYGMALTTAGNQFAVGERVRMAAFLRNVSDSPLQVDCRPDMFGKPPVVVSSDGRVVELSKQSLLGPVAHYQDRLAPGEVFGPLYVNFGLGENPRPGRQVWTPYWSAPVPGMCDVIHQIAVQISDPQVTGDASGPDWQPAKLPSGSIQIEVTDGKGS